MTGGELRCQGKLHGIVTDEGFIEVKCSSVRCGYKPGVVILHYFDPETNALIKTKQYQDAKILFDRDQTEARTQ